MLLNKDIIMDGHPTLRLRAKLVDLPLSKENLNILREMMEYIENSQDEEMVEKYSLRPSVGLAAPQINKSLKMFCMKTFDEFHEVIHQYAVVNPKIISYSETLTYLPDGEGCLSVDEETTGLVKRHKKIKARVNLVDLKTGETKETTLKLSGYPGIVFQHEYDHLLGILFIDKMSESLEDIEPVQFQFDEEEKL
ncbi:MAG: peptide deformylase [Candidatus Izemoplasmatales bacterium]|nr:peptide deformylase [Candidatus Izemoplasmatales bacterium]